MNFDKNPMADVSDGPDHGLLKENHDNLPFEPYVGLGHKTHRFADLIPIADDQDQMHLRESIKQIGLLDPIVLFEGAILDGRHRYKACAVVGIEPRFTDFPGTEEEALQFVLAKNVARRMLTTAQKLTLLLKLRPEIERLREQARANQAAAGEGSFVSAETKLDVLAESGKLVGLGKATVARYNAIEKAADEDPEDQFVQEIIDQIHAGDLGVLTGYEKVKSSRDLSKELDKRALEGRPNPAQQRRALASAIGKAKDSLVHWDYSVLESDYEVRADLEEIIEWAEGALGYAE